MSTAFNYAQLSSHSNNNRYPNSEGIFEKNNRFEIHTLEWMEMQRPSWNSEPEKLCRFEVIWVKGGKGTLWVDEQTFAIEQQTIYCIPPGHVRKCNIETNLQGYYISFVPEFIWLSGSGFHNSLGIEQYNTQACVTATISDEDTPHELEIIARKLKWEFSNYFNQRLELLKGLLNIFMIYFSRNLKECNRDSFKNKESDLVRKFLVSLKKNFITQKMVSDYARQLFVTPNYLNRTVKNATGFTASHHIQQQIILEAKRKAIYTSDSLKKIAYHLGFDNLAHFSKFFKNNSGMNFTEFKKSAIKPE